MRPLGPVRRDWLADSRSGSSPAMRSARSGSRAGGYGTCSGLPGVKNANVRSMLIERRFAPARVAVWGPFPVTVTRCLGAAGSGHMMERYTLRIAVIEKTGRAVQVYGVRPGLSRRNQ